MSNKPYEPIDTTQQWALPDLDTMTGEDLWLIHASTGVDLLDPGTQTNRMCALIWWAARQEGIRYRYKEIRALRLPELMGMLEDLDDDQDDEDQDTEDEDPTLPATPENVSDSQT